MKSNSALPGRLLKSKPTWSNTFGCSATSAFFVLGCARRSQSLREGVGGADGFHRLLRVKVLEIRGTNVKLGFEVDAGVPVHRSEVCERICAESGQIA